MAKIRKNYTTELKQSAIELCEEIGTSHTAKKLGIFVNNLHRWKRKKHIPVEKSKDIIQLQKEIKKLKKTIR